MGVLGEAGIREGENTGEKDEDEWEDQRMALMTALGSLHGPTYSTGVWGPRAPGAVLEGPWWRLSGEAGERKHEPRSASESPES